MTQIRVGRGKGKDMSDIGSDYDAAVFLVEKAEDELIKKDENHPLIAYLFIEDDNESEVAWQALLRRFSRDPLGVGKVKGSMELTFALTRYLIALEEALGKRAPKQDKQDATKSKQLDDFQDSLPF